MNRRQYSITLAVFVLFLGMACLRIGLSFADEGTADRGMVATVHPLATDFGVGVLREGGNAVDAAVAAALMLGVVDGHNSGIGGGCFILIRRPTGEFVAIDGRETAPERASRDMFLKDGQPQTELSRTGPLASATPGALAAYNMAVESFGRKPLAQLLVPAADVAENGFAIDGIYARNLREVASDLARFPGSRAIWLKPNGNGKTLQEGDTLRIPELAETYRAVAQHGVDWFYRGPFAHQVATWMSKNGGLLSEKDFAAYQPKLRNPIRTTFRDVTIIGFPPPSSGGVHVAQILNILEYFPLRETYERDPAEFTHIVAEAMKVAFADRAHWMGDADFAAVPRGLIAPGYAGDLAKRINPMRASPVEAHGMPPAWSSDLFGKHTTHIAAADAEGYWVAITATINTSFGSKVVVPGTGVVLNNEMDDFSIQPGVANAFGLVGAEANSIAPGKRPLSSMSPTIVLRQDRPIMTLGAAGGPTIINQVVLAIIRHIDLGMEVKESLGASRFHHQWSPDVLTVEKTMPAAMRAALESRGHILRPIERIGVTQAIAQPTAGAAFIGVHDPRVSGKAAGW